MIDRDDRDMFMEQIDENVLDEFIKNVYGHDAMKDVDLSDVEISTTELVYVIDSLISEHNRQRNNGEFVEAMISFRIMRKLLEVDPEIEEIHKEAQEKKPNPLEMLLRGAQ